MMKMSKSMKAFVDDAKASDEYWVERAKLDFSIGLEKQRRAGGFKYADIAKKIGTSAAYITKIFRGDTNVTIETMVKLSRAAGGELKIQVVDNNTVTSTWRGVSIAPSNRQMPHTTGPAATIVFTSQSAANHDAFSGQGEAIAA